MGNVFEFPKKSDDKTTAQVTYLQSYLKSNIIKLTEIRAKLVKLQDDIKRLQRGQLKLVPNGHSSGKKD